MKRLRIEVPATSANLGPGFDTLGLALDIADTITVDLDPESSDVSLCEVVGDIGDPLHERDNLLCRAYSAWSADTGTTLPGARFTLESRIPISRGLGSSAASIVAGLAAAAGAAEAKDWRERLLRLAGQMEGHADNTSAAILGGMTAAFLDGEQVHALQVASHLALGVAVFVPVDPLQTAKARAALRESVPMEDAVFNLGRLAYLTTALIWGRWDRIGPAMQDRLHQPCRSSLIPGLDAVIAAALEGGAYGAALSGGGPSVIALGPGQDAERYSAAMESRAHELGWEGKSLVTRVREAGIQIKSEQL